jgi:hypothetical protein
LTDQNLNIAIVGGGAAGFFAAINCKINYPNHQVTIYEKTTKVLSKVKVSGGGRCNVTNATYSISDLAKNYPRGNKQLKKIFTQFNPKDTVDWFESRGVPLITQEDKCIFPKSQNSQSVIDCFLNECKKLKIDILIKHHLVSLKKQNDKFTLDFKGVELIKADKVIVTIGGQSKINGLTFLQELGHHIISPVPSLFTFNMPNEPITQLMGIVVESAQVKIQSTKLVDEGPLLITHWGMSGPAILKLSAWGARILEEKRYKFNVQVNWLKQFNFNELSTCLSSEIEVHKNKKISNQKIVHLPTRLWDFLINKIDLNLNKKWSELSKKEFNRLINVLQNDVYQVEGKTTFKEEFVTCGGVDLSEVNFNTMSSKLVSGLYFAGEVLDVDGITGGFNFQNAWSTGFVASMLK